MFLINFQDFCYLCLTTNFYNGFKLVLYHDSCKKLMATDKVQTEGGAGVGVQPLTQRRAAPINIEPTIYWAIPPLVALDALCLYLSMRLASLLRFELLPYYATPSPEFYNHLVWVFILGCAGLFGLYRLYHAEELFSGLQEYKNIFAAYATGLIILVAYSFLGRDAEQQISRGWLLITWALGLTTTGAARFLFRRLVFGLRERGYLCRRVLIVGASEEGQQVAAQFQANPHAGIQVVGFVDADWRPGMNVSGFPVLGTPDRLANLIGCLRVKDIIIIPTAMKREELLNLYRDWGTDNTVRIHLSSGLYELFTTGARVNEIGFVPLISLNRTRITGVDAVLKAILDRVGALLGLLILSPLFALIAILIKLSSPGPVIYRRRVVGLGGREFDAFKFRTMIPNAEAYLRAHPELRLQWNASGKVQDDPRITRIGRVLRRFSMDELPQLWNVLFGQMSLVGPRMITYGELQHFGRWQHNLVTVKPGMTGLWQISGRSDLSYEDRVRLDMQYIRNYTIWLDIKILLNTVLAVLRGHGAY